MILKSMSRHRLGGLSLVPALAVTLGAAAGALVVTGGVVVAQTQEPPAIAWDARRLERLDRNVRRLERALTQRNAAGDPVIIEADPDDRVYYMVSTPPGQFILGNHKLPPPPPIAPRVAAAPGGSRCARRRIRSENKRFCKKICSIFEISVDDRGREFAKNQIQYSFDSTKLWQ